MSSRNIFVDLDGTLVDVAPRHHRVYVYCIEQFGGIPLKLKEYWGLKRKDTPWPKLLEMSGVDPALQQDFLKLFISRIESPEELLRDSLFPESMAVLEELSCSNTLYLLSLRRNREALDQEIDKLGIGKYFKEILSGHSETKAGTLTKKADIIRATVDTTQNIVVIGDTEADVMAAQSIGAVSIALRSGIRDDQLLLAMTPDYLVDRIGNVPEYLN